MGTLAGDATSLIAVTSLTPLPHFEPLMRKSESQTNTPLRQRNNEDNGRRATEQHTQRNPTEQPATTEQHTQRNNEDNGRRATEQHTQRNPTEQPPTRDNLTEKDERYDEDTALVLV